METMELVRANNDSANAGHESLINKVAQEMAMTEPTAKMMATEMLGGFQPLKSEDAAPDSALARYGIATLKGIGYVPQGLWNTAKYNVEHPLTALGTVGMGVGMTLALRAIIPNTGTAGKIAGAAIGAYFMYKAAEPIIDGYQQAGRATTWKELDQAGRTLGDAGGAFIVNSAIAGVGSKIGGVMADRAFATSAGKSFIESRDNFYTKVGEQGRRLTDGIGLTTPEPVHHGLIPPYLLDELIKRNPENKDFLRARQMLDQQQLGHEGQLRTRAQSPQDMQGAREVYDAQGKEIQPGTKARFEGEKPHANAEVNNAYDYTGDVREFYLKEYKRNGIDGKGMKYVSTVNYGENYENAFWDGKQMTYGRPGPDSPFKTFVIRDVAGHEITHGITEMEANFRYQGQSGALNESMSDVFGSLIKQYANKQTAGKADWVVGEGIWKDNVKGRGLRDMLNPGTAYNDPAIGKDPQPAHMKDYIKTRSDNGGVHLNSGIPNKAFALFAKEVGGNAWEAPGHIWWQARKVSGSTPSFSQFAFNTIEQAKAMGQTALVPKLESAWNSVGVTPSATIGDVLTPSGGGWGDGLLRTLGLRKAS